MAAPMDAHQKKVETRRGGKCQQGHRRWLIVNLSIWRPPTRISDNRYSPPPLYFRKIFTQPSLLSFVSLYLCLCVSASDATIHFIVQCNPQSQYAFHYIVKRTTSRRGLRTSSISNCRLGEDGLGRSGRGKLQRAATVSYQATNGQSTRRKSKVFILLLACVCECVGGGCYFE